jgi:CheY-like chemotaxis protein
MAKILIVDDENEFRSMLRNKLQDHGHEVCEAPDGRTGISLQPVGAFDIVLMDIDLPDISGFEVIRQMKKASTRENIIVVTGDHKIEFVKDVAEQLGARFTFKKPLDVSKLVSMIQQVTDPLKPRERGETSRAFRHEVQFYPDDVFLIEAVSSFVKTSLYEGAMVIIIATEHHRKALQDLINFSYPIHESRAVFYDAEATLATFMRDDWPNKTLFTKEMGLILQQAALTGPARVFGEMVAVLWAQGKLRAAIRLEELWNDLAREQEFTLLCGYPKSAFSNPKDNDLFLQVCRPHTHVHM